MRRLVVLILCSLCLPALAVKDRDPLKQRLLHKCHLRLLEQVGSGVLNYDLPRFRRLWAAPEWNGQAILDFLSENEDVGRLLDSDAGLFQHYTVRQHTLRVFATAQSQDAFLPLDIPAPRGTTWKKIFKLAIALHDISKGVAAEAGNKNDHHPLCVPMAEKIMGALRVQAGTRRLVRSLIEHDLIADVMRDRRSVAESYLALTELAQANEMAPAEFFRIQLFFFTADAASFDNVRKQHFEEASDGSLHPTKQEPFRVLQRSFGLE